MRAYWWQPGNAKAGWTNAGDQLTPLVLREFAGIEAEWATAADSQVVVVGSIATMLPRQYTGAVLGIGKAREAPIDLSRADVRALRGPLTLRGSGVTHPVALGDPGLLVSLLYPERDITSDIGVVPHWQDGHLAGQYPGALVIDVRRPVEQVIAEIASCERIVASSLHGLIIADAYGIPRRWSWFPRVQGATENGGAFKFSDYALGLGEDLTPGKWGCANPRRVEQAQADLREAIGDWAAYMAGDYV